MVAGVFFSVTVGYTNVYRIVAEASGRVVMFEESFIAL